MNQTEEIKRLVEDICNQLGVSIRTGEIKKQKLNKSALSPRRLFSPKGNTNLEGTKPSHLLPQSPKSPRTNMNYTSTSPKFMNIGYKSFGATKMRGVSPPAQQYLGQAQEAEIRV